MILNRIPWKFLILSHILQCADNDHHLANNMNFTLKCKKKISYIHARQYLCLYMIVEILFFSLQFHTVSTTISSFQSCKMHGWKNMEHILFAQIWKKKFAPKNLSQIFAFFFFLSILYISYGKTVENSKKIA